MRYKYSKYRPEDLDELDLEDLLSRLSDMLLGSGFDDPYGHLGGDPHPIEASRDVQFIPYGAFGATDPDINSPRVQSWNVTVERQFGAEWGIAASYLGSYTDRLWLQIQENPGVFLGTGPCTINGVSYNVCSTAANLNQRRVLSLSGELSSLTVKENGTVEQVQARQNQDRLPSPGRTI